MEVRPGYKQTEVGAIPEEWNVSRLGAMAETSSGTTPARAMQERYYRNGSIAWVKTMDLNNSEITSTSEQVTELAFQETSLRAYPIGTVLVAMYGGFQQIGRTGLLRIPSTVNQAISAVQPDPTKLVPEYLLATLNHRVEYWKRVASSSRKDPNISSQDIRNFPIAYPPPPEQRAIATALSDVDGMLGGLDRLIAKKRDLKQAAMQQLLTGQSRIPGFSGQWEVKPLGDVCRPQKGELITEATAVPGEIPVVAGGQEPSYFHNRPNRTGKTITISGSGAYAGFVSFFDVPIFASDCSTINESSGYSIEFLYYQLVLKQGEIYRSQTGGAQPHVYPSDIAPLILHMPDNVPEQTAIAAALSDMDAELAALKARRDKTRDLKQAMMQELLTGRTRLV